MFKIIYENNQQINNNNNVADDIENNEEIWVKQINNNNYYLTQKETINPQILPIIIDNNFNQTQTDNSLFNIITKSNHIKPNNNCYTLNSFIELNETNLNNKKSSLQQNIKKISNLKNLIIKNNANSNDFNVTNIETRITKQKATTINELINFNDNITSKQFINRRHIKCHFLFNILFYLYNLKFFKCIWYQLNIEDRAKRADYISSKNYSFLI